MLSSKDFEEIKKFSRLSNRVTRLGETLRPLQEQMEQISKALPPIEQISKDLLPGLSQLQEQMEQVSKSLSPVISDVQKRADKVVAAFNPLRKQMMQISEACEKLFGRK